MCRKCEIRQIFKSEIENGWKPNSPAYISCMYNVNLNLFLVQIRSCDTKTQFCFLSNTSKSVCIGFNQRYLVFASFYEICLQCKKILHILCYCNIFLSIYYNLTHMKIVQSPFNNIFLTYRPMILYQHRSGRTGLNAYALCVVPGQHVQSPHTTQGRHVSLLFYFLFKRSLFLENCVLVFMLGELKGDCTILSNIYEFI